jgi:hypothetical protein
VRKEMEYPTQHADDAFICSFREKKRPNAIYPFRIPPFGEKRNV